MNKEQQLLFWALSKPIKYLGFTLDEWGVLVIGIIPGIFLLNSGRLKLGIIVIITGITLCYIFKKFKRVARQFKLKSFLVAKGIFPAPPAHPNTLNKEVGR